MFWVLLFVAIAVIGLAVVAFSLLRLYRRFRALLGSVDRFGRTIADGADALARIEASAVTPTTGDVVHSKTARADWSRSSEQEV